MVASALLSLGAAAALALPASASPAFASLEVRSFQFPDTVPLEKRQVSGPQFQCHSNCGNTITGSESGTAHCDDDEWLELLDACLICVEEFPIWQWYGDGVTAGAEACGLIAEPGSPARPSSPTEPSETPSETSASETAGPTGEPTPSATSSDDGSAPPQETSTTESAEPTYAPSGTDSPKPPKPTESDDEDVPSPSHSAAPPAGNETSTSPEPPHVTSNAAAGLAGAGSILGLGALAAALVL